LLSLVAVVAEVTIPLVVEQVDTELQQELQGATLRLKVLLH
jgi:hypothetical protein